MKPDCNKCRFSYRNPKFKEKVCRYGFSPFKGFLNTFVPPMPYYCVDDAAVLYSKGYGHHVNIQLEINFKD